jgi:phage host-nuclease inhibitor protein Gam
MDMETREEIEKITVQLHTVEAKLQSLTGAIFDYFEMDRKQMHEFCKYRSESFLTMLRDKIITMRANNHSSIASRLEMVYQEYEKNP